jgi:hypothetical protein
VSRFTGEYSDGLDDDVGIETVAAPAMILNDIIIIDADAQFRAETFYDGRAQPGKGFAKRRLILLKAAAQLMPGNVSVFFRLTVALLITRKLGRKDIEQLVSAPPYLDTPGEENTPACRVDR